MVQEQIDLKEVNKEIKELKRRIDNLSKLFEDMEFARRTEEAYQRHENGDYIETDSEEDFFATLNKEDGKDKRERDFQKNKI